MKRASQLVKRVKGMSFYSNVRNEVSDKYTNLLALSDGERSADCLQLWKEVNILSKQVLRYIKPGKVVALHLKPGIDFVVAMLGIIRSGNVYLSINLEYSTALKMHILKDSKAALVICDESHEMIITDAVLRASVLVKKIGDFASI